MTTAAPESVEYLPLYRWRCGGCGSRMRLLGVYTELGGALIQHGRNRHGRDDCPATRAVIVDLANGRVVAHCANCHEWRVLELRKDAEDWTITERQWTRPVPVACNRPGDVPALPHPL